MPTQSEPLPQQNSPQHFATHLNLNHLTRQHFSSSDQRSHCKKTRQATFKVDKHKQSDFQTLLGIPCETQKEPSPTSKGENKIIPTRGLGPTAMMMKLTQAVKAFKTNTVRTLKAGCAWDELMKKQLTFNCLLKYPDPEIGNY